MAVRVGETGRAASRGLRRLTSPTGLRGVGTELAWVAAHAALYPLGFRTERRAAAQDPRRIDDLSPQHRGLLAHDAAAAATPVLLVHGMIDNRSIFTLLRRSLRRCGFGRVRTVNYSVFTSDIRAAAVELGRTVEQVCAETGYERVHVVAHSLGGVVARYYVQRRGGDARVHTLVTLGAPHGGTVAAWRPGCCRCGCAGNCGRTRTSSPSWPSRRRAAGPGSWPSGATSTSSSTPRPAPGSNTPTWSRTTC